MAAMVEQGQPSMDRRRRNVRLALIIAAVALALYFGLWLKASML